MLYEILDGTVSLQGETVLSHIDFSLHGTEKIAVVGANGTGKSTLLRLIAGELSLDRDDKSNGGIRRSRSLTVGYLPQHVFTGADGSRDKLVQELIMEACPSENEWDQDRFFYEQEYDRMLTAFGFSKDDKEKPIREFSGGQQVRIALIRLMLERPDILLLDEPTNHLDQEMVEWLEEWIRNYEKAVIYVSHDRYFMDRTADVVYEISKGKLRRFVGNYSAYVEQKEKLSVQLLKEWERQQEEVERLNALIKKFHNKPRKASFARSRQKILDRMELMDKPEDMVIRPHFAPLVPQTFSGKHVLEIEHLQIGYEKGKPLMELQLSMRRGQKIGIIGPNGIGKSTFLKTILGELKPLAGTCNLGHNVEPAYFDQLVIMPEEDETVLAHYHNLFPALTEREIRVTLSRWGLKGKTVAQKVKALSGGEKSKLRFAELFQACPNFLILDEPVNHLDMAAREVLACALQAYEGTVLFVSHDRYFTDQVASGLLILGDQETSAVYYPFNYSHYAKHYHKSQTHLRAEEMAMVEDFRKVPERETGMLREISTEAAYLDWQYGLLREEMEPLTRRIEALEKTICQMKEAQALKEWEVYLTGSVIPETGAENDLDELQAQLSACYERYTALCIAWDEM